MRTEWHRCGVALEVDVLKAAARPPHPKKRAPEMGVIVSPWCVWLNFPQMTLHGGLCDAACSTWVRAAIDAEEI